jgi:hypothetical protein
LQSTTGDHRQSADFSDHGNQARGRTGAQTLFDRPQDFVVTGGVNDRETRRVKPVDSQPRPVQIGLLQTPQHRASAQPRQDAGNKTGNGGAVLFVAAGAQDFVHSAERQPAFRQDLVDGIDAERQHAMAQGDAELDLSNLTP